MSFRVFIPNQFICLYLLIFYCFVICNIYMILVTSGMFLHVYISFTHTIIDYGVTQGVVNNCFLVSCQCIHFLVSELCRHHFIISNNKLSNFVRTTAINCSFYIFSYCAIHIIIYSMELKMSVSIISYL